MRRDLGVQRANNRSPRSRRLKLKNETIQDKAAEFDELPAPMPGSEKGRLSPA